MPCKESYIAYIIDLVTNAKLYCHLIQVVVIILNIIGNLPIGNHNNNYLCLTYLILNANLRVNAVTNRA